MTKILSIATAGLLENQLKDTAHIYFPRVDYVELGKLLGAQTIDYSAYGRSFTGDLFRRMEREMRSDLYLTLLSWIKSRRCSTVFAWSERAGIPFAAFRRVFPSKIRFVTMFQSWSNRQEAVLSRFKLFRLMDDIIVHCESMRHNLIRLGAPAGRVQVIHYSIDQNFFSPRLDIKQEPGRIIALGETRSRDYNSLFQAIQGLPVLLEVAGYGQWYAREKANKLIDNAPMNVAISRRLTHLELREFYSRSAFVILPVRDLVYSAGATGALEAGCMARAAIAFRSQGITDYIVDGETGLLIDPGDTTGMKAAIQYLLANPADAKRMGENARQRILEEFRLETYVTKISNVLLKI